MISSAGRATVATVAPGNTSTRQTTAHRSIPSAFRGTIQTQAVTSGGTASASTSSASKAASSQDSATLAASVLSARSTAGSLVTTAGATAASSTSAPTTDTGGNSPRISGTISSVTLDGLNQLVAALRAAGIDPNSLNMVAHDDPVYFPGTSWTNTEITLTANGHTENFGANLIVLNPNVAVTEIKHLLALG